VKEVVEGGSRERRRGSGPTHFLLREKKGGKRSTKTTKGKERKKICHKVEGKKNLA